MSASTCKMIASFLHNLRAQLTYRSTFTTWIGSLQWSKSTPVGNKNLHTVLISDKNKTGVNYHAWC